MSLPFSAARRAHRRPLPYATRRWPGKLALVSWTGGLLSAGVLVLGVNGTLADWTVALLHDTPNTVAVTDRAVILKETSGAAGCVSTSGAGASNEYTCSTINKYGGTGTGVTPLSPGQSRSTTVTLANTGTAAGTLTLKADACSSSGGISVGSVDLCGVLQVSVTCGGTTIFPTSGTATVTAFGTASTAVSVATLAKDATVDCTFRVALAADVTPAIAGQAVSQQLNWTLSAV